MMATPHPPLPTLSCRYLLVIHVPLVIDRQQRRWIEGLWAVDLHRHTDYIRDLTVACPFVRGERADDAVAADERGLRFVSLPYPLRSLVSLLRAPLTLWQVWRLVGRYDFVHSIYGDWWPFATPYIVNLVARLRGKCLMINVEASPWRLVRGERASPFRRFKARLAEKLNRWTISLADLAVFTHEGYLRDLLPERAERGHVLHASWIDEAVILDAATAAARWQARRRDAPAPLKLLFAGRLNEDKGVHVMLEALRLLRADGRTRVQLSIIGTGELLALCRDEAARMSEHEQAHGDARVRLELLQPVPYGEPFFALLRRFDAVLVPSLADEQPRIVYDAYSQALPVLASSTPGLRTCVADGVNGHLFAPADAPALAEAVRWAAREPEALQRMGLAALDSARATTHQGMHRRRHALIAATLAARGLA